MDSPVGESENGQDEQTEKTPMPEYELSIHSERFDVTIPVRFWLDEPLGFLAKSKSVP